jgi:hypothetical protein
MVARDITLMGLSLINRSNTDPRIMAASLVKFTKTLWEAILQTELVTVNGLP